MLKTCSQALKNVSNLLLNSYRSWCDISGSILQDIARSLQLSTRAQGFLNWSSWSIHKDEQLTHRIDMPQWHLYPNTGHEITILWLDNVQTILLFTFILSGHRKFCLDIFILKYLFPSCLIINIMSVYILHVRRETCFLLFIFSQGNEFIVYVLCLSRKRYENERFAIFYLETKGYLKVVAFKQYLKNLLFI